MKITRYLKPFVAAITHLPRLIQCDICGGTRIQIRTDASPRIGSRCLFCRGTAHHRGTFRAIRDIYGSDLHKLKGGSVYEISAHGTLHAALSRLSNQVGFEFSCSEYKSQWTPGAIYDGVRCENIEALTFPDSSFDLITSTGLMEHVEHDDVGFREIARVLKPGGHYVFTVPLQASLKHTQIRAVRRNGNIEHLLPPEYHSDPWHPNGVFTWRNYGPDIINSLAKAGLQGEIRKIKVSGLDGSMPVIIASSLHKPGKMDVQ